LVTFEVSLQFQVCALLAFQSNSTLTIWQQKKVFPFFNLFALKHNILLRNTILSNQKLLIP